MSWELRHMKLKVCFCNKTVLKTDITRFAPVWASYLLGLAMMVLLQFSGGSDDTAKTSIVHDFNRLCMLGVGVNGLYALVVVQALFGDLLNPRLCNALHAMPVTRDGYYGAHLIAGVLFALVPNCLVLLPTSLLLPRQVASVALLALLALSLQYIFYLGTALTAVQLAGNRIGMVLIYGILNFATVLLYWFVAMVFTPLIYGKDISISWIARICPTVAMYEGNYFNAIDHSYYLGDTYHYVFDGISMGDVWLKAAICAGLGVEIDYAFQALENVPEGFSVPEGRSKPWGTGQAVLACKGIIKEPFAVINADDYYGKEAFVRLHDFLQGYTPDKPGDLAMAGFVLKNTLSDNGAVTRGICQMNDAHYLTGVLETSGIEKTADGAAAGGKSIDIDSLVSMNMWALTPEFVDLLESGFVEFFEKAAPANPLKAEYLLPIYIDELLHADKVSVKVLPTHDKWFGVTYAEDKQTVIDSFARLVADGVYKKDLFSDLKK